MKLDHLKNKKCVLTFPYSFLSKTASSKITIFILIVMIVMLIYFTERFEDLDKFNLVKLAIGDLVLGSS